MPEIVKLQVKLSRGVESYFVTIPKTFIKELGWKKGDNIVVDIVNDEEKYIILKKVKI